MIQFVVAIVAMVICALCLAFVVIGTKRRSRLQKQREAEGKLIREWLDDKGYQMWAQQVAQRTTTLSYIEWRSALSRELQDFEDGRKHAA